jgi:mediator of RNA polymerase II transcription subunit 18
MSRSQNQTHYYEVALFGEFFARDLKAILNRFTLNSESAQRLHTREVLFEPLDAHFQRESGSDPVILRAKKDLTEPDSDWALYSYLKPEPVSVHPEATVRPWALTHVSGDALTFASALGYTCGPELLPQNQPPAHPPVL